MSGFNVSGHGGNCINFSCISGGNSKSTSTKYPVSASFGVCKILLRSFSELVRNVAEHVSSGTVPDVGWFVSSETVCNVAGFMVSDVGLVSNAGGLISSNFMSL